MMIGTDIAARFPSTAVRVLFRAWRQGGDYRNAYDVLVSAFGTVEAHSLIALHEQPDTAALMDAIHANGVTS